MREIKLGTKTIKVRKLTVREASDFIDDRTKYPLTFAELYLDRTLPERVVSLTTGLPTEELNGDVDPDELDALWQAVEEENHFLSRMYGKLMTISAEMADPDGVQPTSNELPADLSDSAMPE